jgi:hypothetical protein
MIHLLTALAVQNGRTIKQADCKFAFIQATLPPEEITVVKPPVGCPFSNSHQYWRLKKSLYGLHHAPLHWYNVLHSILESPELGLKCCPHDPCIFHGSLIPGKPPLYVAIYVDDIIFFSLDDDVEQYFCSALSQKRKVEFLGDAECYIGIKFDWNRSSYGSLSYRSSQEGFAAAIVEEMGLLMANKSPLMTPFHSGFPIDTNPHVDMSPEDRAPLISKMECWMGMLNWLQQCTCPDLATIFSLSASHMHCPRPGHHEAAKYIGHYILSTLDLGLVFSNKATSSFESYIYFPLPDTCENDPNPLLTTFCDANWGPQDASHPSPSNTHSVSIHESKSICGQIFFFVGCPILWKTHKEAKISHSSCEVEIKATDECVKNVQMVCNILSDLLLCPTGPIPINNDNCADATV